MPETFCKNCFQTIIYGEDADIDGGPPEFCSTGCSRAYWKREIKPYDEEWYQV